jgi:hypothetical protein
MIQTNIAALNKAPWEELSDSLTVRSSGEGKSVGYLQLVVDKISGQILDISNRPRVSDGVAVSLVEVEETKDPSHPKIALKDDTNKLPKEIREFVSEAFRIYNKG